MIQAARKKTNVQLEGKLYPFQFIEYANTVNVLKSIFGGFEYPIWPFLKLTTGTILDVGANIGATALFFAAHCPQASLLAFEPSRVNFELLQANTASVANVRCFPHGIYDRECTARLFHGLEAHSHDSVSANVLSSPDWEEVRLRPLSSVIVEEGIESIALLKVDTEGCEVPILRDVEPFLDRIRAIFLEFHSENDRLEIDQLLRGRFLLWRGRIVSPHRGVLCYAAREMVPADLEGAQIQRPCI